MKSVGEAMAIGRTFKQAFAKAMRSRELDAPPPSTADDDDAARRALERPAADRFDLVLEALAPRRRPRRRCDARTASTRGSCASCRSSRSTRRRRSPGERTFKSVDTCAAEFAARTPYYYSGWERRAAPTRSAAATGRSVVILGAGPNRIGQGIEFDYCCVHAAMTVREAGRDAVMVNCNPETVSTDYDTSDRLYFEPLTLEDVLGVFEVEQPEGVIVQFGGQTPLKLAPGSSEAGRAASSARRRRDRPRRGPRPLRRAAGRARLRGAAVRDGALGVEEALDGAGRVGFPLLVRPSYVLGGRAMEIVYSTDGLLRLPRARPARGRAAAIFLDRFLENAIEVDVDALCDGEDVWIGGIMQHVEEAGIHSGDSACVLPPHSLGHEMLEQIRAQTRGHRAARSAWSASQRPVRGPRRRLYVIEANPRASRTVPFVSKAVGVPLAKVACRFMLGERLADLDLPADAMPTDARRVKEAVLPFDRFAGADALLGPEMRSTGEVMGIARDFPTAFAKAQAAAGAALPAAGHRLHHGHRQRQARRAWLAAQVLHDLGFRIVATRGTAEAIERMGIPALELKKIGEGSPNVVDWIESGEVDLVVNTPTGSGARTDGWEIRRAAVTRGIPCLTTLSAGLAAARAIASVRRGAPRGALAAGGPPRRIRAMPAAPPAAARPARRPRGRTAPAPEAVGGDRPASRRPRELAGGPRPRPVAAGPGAHAPPRRPGRSGRCRPCRRAAGAAAPAPGPARPRAARPGLGPRAAGARRAGRRLRQGRASASTRSARSASASSRSGPSRRRRSPATRGRASSACPPTARSSTAWASTTAARRRPPRASRAGAPGPRVDVVVGVNLGRTKVVAEAEARRRTTPPARAPRRRTPTTSSSTSARRTRPACATSRPSPRCARCSSRCARRSTRRAARAGAAAREDRAGPGRRRRRRGRRPRARARARRHHRDEHDDRAARALASDAARCEAAGPGGLSGPPLAPRALAVLRRLRARTGDRLVLRRGGRDRDAGGRVGAARARARRSSRPTRASSTAARAGRRPCTRGSRRWPAATASRPSPTRSGRTADAGWRAARRPPVGRARRGGRSACRSGRRRACPGAAAEEPPQSAGFRAGDPWHDPRRA